MVYVRTLQYLNGGSMPHRAWFLVSSFQQHHNIDLLESMIKLSSYFWAEFLVMVNGLLGAENWMLLQNGRWATSCKSSTGYKQLRSAKYDNTAFKGQYFLTRVAVSSPAKLHLPVNLRFFTTVRKWRRKSVKATLSQCLGKSSWDWVC